MAEKEPNWAVFLGEAKKGFEVMSKANGNLVDWGAELAFAKKIFEGSNALPKCNGASITNAMVNVAAVGLTLNPAMKLAYIVPRKGVACLDISYMGLVKLATDSGSVLQVASVPVHATDKFEWISPFDLPLHKFDPFAKKADRGEVVGVFCAARIANGCLQVDPMSREDVDKIRKMSRAESGPWFDWFEEMVKKTVIKRASKLWPRTQRLVTAEAILNEHEGIEFDHQHSALEPVQAIEGPKAKSEAPKKVEAPSPKKVEPPAQKNVEAPSPKKVEAPAPKKVLTIAEQIAACPSLEELAKLSEMVQAMPKGAARTAAVAAGRERSAKLKEGVTA